MRRQYHFRNSEKGLLAWDVHRLIALSRDLPVMHVALAEIAELDEPYWFARTDPHPTVRDIAEHARLISDVDLTVPILMCPEGRAMDGMHRVARAFMEGHTTIAARQFLVLPEPDHTNVDPAELDYEALELAP